MKRIAALLLIAALTNGCASTRYVSVPCITQEQYEELQKAEPPKVSDKLTGRADEDIKMIGGSAVRLRSWGHGLLNVLGGCVG